MTDDNAGAGDEPPDALATDLIIPGLGCALAVYFLISTSDLVWEARATGTTIGVILMALCGLHLTRIVRKRVRGPSRFSFGDLFEIEPFNRQRVLLLVCLIVFIATIRWLGTTLGLFLLLIAMLLVMGVREPRRLIGIAFASAATVYVLFILLLDSRMPRGALEHALAGLWPGAGG